MKREDLQRLQPQLYAGFQRILEEGRLSHAYLFTGSFGSFDMALLLSQSLFCEEKDGAWACGKCRSCRLIAEEDFSDVTVVRPVNQIIKTERVRELIRNFSQSGVESSRQVFLICQADKMHTNAANSLLKVIEEPQSEIYIFLLTADEQRVLPTIRSRAQVYHFPKQQAAMEQQLEQAGLVKDQAALLAGYAQTQEEAEKLTGSSAFFELAGECARFTKTALSNPDQAYLQAARLTKLAEDKEKQEQVFKILELLLAREMKSRQGRRSLEKLLGAKSMWQANVSFQNTLEYMVLTP